MSPTQRAAVIGAGIVGLSAAEKLHEAGFDVTVIARDFRDTTSMIAAGLIEPVLVSNDDDRISTWFRGSYEPWLARAETRPQWGVDRRRVQVFSASSDAALPAWIDAVHGFRHLPAAALPAAYQGGSGYEFESAVVQPPLYLRRLRRWLMARGVTFQRREVLDAAELVGLADVVINATSLGSRKLFGDDQLEPVRGDLLIYPVVPAVDRVMADWETFTYLIPQRSRLVAGGTAVLCERDPETWDVAPRAEVAADIRRRVATLAPELAGVEPVGYDVGLRPGRRRVRVETQLVGSQPVVHLVGTGGSGWTLAPGIADDGVRLARLALARAAPLVA